MSRYKSFPIQDRYRMIIYTHTHNNINIHFVLVYQTYCNESGGGENKFVNMWLKTYCVMLQMYIPNTLGSYTCTIIFV